MRLNAVGEYEAHKYSAAAVMDDRYLGMWSILESNKGIVGWLNKKWKLVAAAADIHLYISQSTDTYYQTRQYTQQHKHN